MNKKKPLLSEINLIVLTLKKGATIRLVAAEFGVTKLTIRDLRKNLK